MKIDFIRQLLVLIFSFMLSLLSVVVAEHVHLSTPEAVDCELCTHAGSDATLYVSQACLPLTAPQDLQTLSIRFVIYSKLIHKHPRGPPLFSAQ
ncbi:MAG: hypothetical protein ACJATP_001665 [Candidatus Azotimanducaceae bacterium]|jgi:hypothetical protein